MQLTTLILFVVGLAITAAMSQFQHHISGSNYKAPLVDDPNSGLEIIPSAYLVELQPGHTIAQHERVIGISLQLIIDHVFDPPWRGKVAYSAHHVDDSLLAAIRADPGVEMVAVSRKPEPEAGLE
jgi:hypothetical protein